MIKYSIIKLAHSFILIHYDILLKNVRIKNNLKIIQDNIYLE